MWVTSHHFYKYVALKVGGNSLQRSAGTGSKLVSSRELVDAFKGAGKQEHTSIREHKCNLIEFKRIFTPITRDKDAERGAITQRVVSSVKKKKKGEKKKQPWKAPQLNPTSCFKEQGHSCQMIRHRGWCAERHWLIFKWNAHRDWRAWTLQQQQHKQKVK